MSNVIERPARRTAPPKLPLRALHEELAALQPRVEDLEDRKRICGCLLARDRRRDRLAGCPGQAAFWTAAARARCQFAGVSSATS